MSKTPALPLRKCCGSLHLNPKFIKGIHATAVIGENASFGPNASVHALAFIGDNVTLGDNCVIYPFAYVGDNVTLGNNCVIYPQVVLHDDTEIGNGVVIHSGSVLGTDGFGYMFIENRHYKIPQIGRVIVEDDVEIGANVTIDRARTGSTRIGAGTKIDNLVHIGHNVSVGKNCVIVAQVGVSGSVEIGDGVILAGQVGIKDHVKIGDGSIVAAKTGVIGDLPPQSFVSGMYGRPHGPEMRAQAVYSKLPELYKQIRTWKSGWPLWNGTSRMNCGPGGHWSATACFHDVACIRVRRRPFACVPRRPARDLFFVDTASRQEILAHPQNVTDTSRCTILAQGIMQVQTVEHVLAALAGLGVTDARIETSGGEMPAADGSALPFVRLLNEVGLCEHGLERVQPLVITSPVVVQGEGEACVALLPSDRLRVTVVLDYPASLTWELLRPLTTAARRSLQHRLRPLVRMAFCRTCLAARPWPGTRCIHRKCGSAGRDRIRDASAFLQ